MAKLPVLAIGDLRPTRDYLREVSLVLGSLQRGFLAKHPRQWQHGLEVNLRGLTTQPFVVAGEEVRASLDLVKYKVRLGDSKWPLHEYSPPEIWENLKAGLGGRGIDVKFDEPEFAAGTQLFDTVQADAYAEALWQIEAMFSSLKATLSGGVSSPILLYPHHFDLSLTWFPHDDERQLAVGFSTGDETILEPYLYLTAYPEPQAFTEIKLPAAAYWHKDGFSGAVLAYAAIQASDRPAELFKIYAGQTIAKARTLFD